MKLTTDASNYAIGTVLSLEDEIFDHPVAFFSRTLSKAEQSYDAMRKELLAIVNAAEYFKSYLYYGHHVTLITDNRAFMYLANKADLPQQLQN